MSSPELLQDLLATILNLQKELAGSDPDKFSDAQEAYRELLDDFYEEYQDMMAPQQYEAAKKDPDYFIVLIQLAYYYQKSRVSIDDGDERVYPNWKLFTQC